MPDTPRPPAHLAPYVEVLGPEDAERCFLTMGGKEIYLTTGASGRSELARLFGVDRARALAGQLGVLKVRVPTAKPWLAATMKARGLTVAEIATTLHVTDVAVRKMLSRGTGDGHRRRAPDVRQMSLL